jgi:outer membrane receptor for ferrienterochelin and colicin
MKKTKLLIPSLLLSTAISGLANAQTIDYSMMESIFGESVTASATGKPQRVSDAPVSMEIIGNEEIRRSGAKDIPQLLMRVSGVPGSTFLHWTCRCIRTWLQQTLRKPFTCFN